LVDFINEVEEELRKDKYNVLLRKFGPYIAALLILIVAGTGYIEFRKYQDTVTARRASASYVAAGKLADEGDLQAAIEKFVALSDIAPSGYSGLSLSRAAAIKVQLGDLSGAVKLFDRSAEVFTKPVHKDLSSLKAAYILMELGRYDDVTARAATLASDAGPYQDLAKELVAHAALKSGDNSGAKTKFTYLANAPGVLSGVKQRAAQSLSLINANKPVPVPDMETDNIEIVAPKPEQPEPQEDNQ